MSSCQFPKGPSNHEALLDEYTGIVCDKMMNADRVNKKCHMLKEYN